MKVIMIVMLCSLVQLANGQGKDFLIIGKIEGLKPGTMVTLLTVNDQAKINYEFDLTDSISTISQDNGLFKLMGNVSNNGKLYLLRIKDKKDDVTLFLSGKEKIRINGNILTWPNVLVSGSSASAEWHAYKKRFDVLFKENDKQRTNTFRNDYLIKNPNSHVAAYIILRSSGLTLEERIVAYTNLTQEAKNGYWGKMIKLFLEDVERRKAIQENLAIGNIIPDFEITKLMGEKTKISDLISKSKYTLIDFWASWCAPCRDAMPNMRSVYKAFFSKGFNIVGVSSDIDFNAWQKALAIERLPWDNGLDNVEKASTKKFGIIGIPGYVLVDQHGKILATELVQVINGKANPPSGSQLSNNLYQTIEKLTNQHENK